MNARRFGLLFVVLLIVAALCALPGVAQAAPGDVVPPLLHSLGVNPTAVDTTGGARVATATALITDDLSGVSAGMVQFSSPSSHIVEGQFHRVAGDVFAASITVPRYAESGVWTATWFESEDAVGNYGSLDAADLAAMPTPPTITVSGPSDTEAPEISTLGVAPTSVDTTGGSRIVTITATLTDDLSGVAAAEVDLESPSHGQGLTAVLHRASGTTWTGTVTIPRYAESGIWTVPDVMVRDAVGHTIAGSAIDLGFDVILTVAGPSDVTSPALGALTAVPASVDVTAGPRTVTVTATITDDLSGVTSGYVGFDGPASGQYVGAALSRVTGNTFRAVVTVPRFAEAGVWTIDHLDAYDSAGNELELGLAELTPLGMAPTFTVTVGCAIAAFAPATGFPGSSVVLTGSGFTGATAVRFHGVATTFHVDSDTRLTAVVPAGATSGTIQVTSPDGTGTSASTFTILGVPAISSFTPASGIAGTVVTITGSGFSAASSVRFNGAAASFSVASDTRITATVPAAARTGPITVTTAFGSAASSSSFTVYVAPRVASFTPATGPAGTSVAIVGSGFTGTTAVRFHGTSAAFTVVNDTRIAATVPAGATSGPVSVTTPGGTGTSTSSFTLVTIQHARSIGLDLRQHLVAKGTVRVSDGFSSCAIGMTVRIQFRHDQGWRTIRTGETDAAGRFRVALPDREGVYRAVAVRTVMNAGNDVCAAATSSRERYYD